VLLLTGLLLLIFAVGYVTMARYLDQPGGLYAFVRAGLGFRMGDGASYVAGAVYALIAAGMTLDVSKICEPAMVLRPVGTHNKKSAGTKEVKLLSQLEAFDPMELATILKKFVKPAPAAATGKKGRTSSVMSAILDTEFPPADHKLIELRCHHISVIAQTGGNVDEPLWHKSIGIAKHCIDGRAVAHKWSEGYPGYTAAETDKKFDAWGMGPTTCKVFESLDKSPCDN